MASTFSVGSASSSTRWLLATIATFSSVSAFLLMAAITNRAMKVKTPPVTFLAIVSPESPSYGLQVLLKEEDRADHCRYKL